jgi:molybdopterin converting factor subunit 1
MKVRVKLFAIARELAGLATVEVELEEPATVQALRTALARQIPALAGVLPGVVFAVDAHYVKDNARLSEDSESACIPPVSGG